MLYNTLHNRWMRLVAAVFGELIAAVAQKLFIVPMNMYTGGLMGMCQLARTLMQTTLGVNFGTDDIAGILYFILNIPILLLAYKTLGRSFVVKTLICTLSYSFFYSAVPIPAQPIVEDYLTSCLLGGILVGIGSGIVLTCGGSGGGLDIVGLCLNKRGSSFTVGNFPDLQLLPVRRLLGPLHTGSGYLLGDLQLLLLHGPGSCPPAKCQHPGADLHP